MTRLLLPALVLTLLGASFASAAEEAKEAAREPAAQMGTNVRPVALQPGHGMVIGRLIQTHDVGLPVGKWRTMWIREVSTGKEIGIVSNYGSDHNGLFVESLAPGEYEADRLALGIEGFGPHSWGEFGPESWRFTIEAGRLTNLGTLFFLSPYNPPGAFVYRLVLAPDVELPQRNTFVVTADAQALMLSKANTWKSIPAISAYSLLTPQMKRMSMSLGGGSVASDGGRLFGELFGQVAWRHPDGSWTWEDTGTLESLLFAADVADGTRYAAAESSVVLRRDGADNWRRVPLALNDATPCLLHPDRDGSLLTVWEQYGKLTVLRLAPKSEAWTTERVIDLPTSIFSSAFGRCHAFVSAQRLAIAGTSMTSKTRFEFFDFATKEWTRAELKTRPVRMKPDGTLYAMGGSLWKPKLRTTPDSGKTWQETALPGYTSQVVFRTPDEGFAIAFNDYSVTSGSYSGKTLWRTADGGKNWQAVEVVPKLTSWILPLDGQEILMSTENGLFSSSGDNGKTLRRERDSTAPQW